MLQKMVNNAIALGVIPEDEAEVYAYSYSNFFYMMLAWASLILFGAVFQRLLGSLVFMLFFVPLRQYAGGIHIRSRLLCTLMTSLVFLGIVALSYVKLTEPIMAGICIAILVAVIVIFLCAPQEDENKPATENERKHCGKMAKAIAAAESMLFCISMVLGAPWHITFFMGVGIILPAVLVGLKWLQRRAHY